MAWLVSCGGRTFSLDPTHTRDSLVNDLNGAVANNSTVAVSLASGDMELVFYPHQLDYLLYAAGDSTPQVATMPTTWTGTVQPMTMPTTPGSP